MFFRQVFDPKLAQYAYLVGCQQTGEAIVIDPERDVDRYLELAAAEGLRIVAATETHIHADFLSGCRELAHRAGAAVYLSDEGGPDWSYEWADQGNHQIRWLHDGDTFSIGHIELQAVHTPGHTPEHLCFLITDRGGGASDPMGMASGDFVFVGDLGRPDLLESAAGVAGAMEPSARRLYHSTQQFLALPDYLQIWPGHGAGSACGKALGAVPETTVGYERRFSPALDAAARGEDAFVDFILSGQPEPPLYFARMKRENKLGPKLLGELPSPRELGAEELAGIEAGREVAVLDTRLDRRAFMARHLPGSIYAPLNKSFPTIAGSYVEEDAAIFLVLDDPERLEEAVRDLVRIGLDRVEGFAGAETLRAAGRIVELGTIDVTGFGEVLRRGAGADAPLDVRRQTEFEAGHLPEAFNIAHTRLLERLAEVPEEGTYAVYCRTGARAASAASLLAAHGRRVVYVDDAIAEVPADALARLETPVAAGSE